MADETVSDDEIARVMRELGRRGGKAQVPKGTASLTPEERAELGRKGAEARWADKRKIAKKKARKAKPAK